MAIGRYQQAYDQARNDPEAYWAEQARALPWITAPKRVLDPGPDGTGVWFADGELNTAWLCLDRHVEEGRGEQTALIYDSPVTGRKHSWSFVQLTEWVARAAGMLADLGVGKGDRVVIYMPMVPEAVVAMLACARLGAVHSVVFGGFSAAELASRIDDCAPRVVLTASCGIEFANVIAYEPLVSAALMAATHKVAACVWLQRPEQAAQLPGRDAGVPDATGCRHLNWAPLLAASNAVAAVPVAATDPLYILYTSGTTGKPKGVVRDNGGHAVALHTSMQQVYGMGPGDVFWAASDVGWVVGHSYIVYGPLLRGCSTVLFEGKPVRTPDAGSFWRVMAEHKVNAFFTAPTAFRAIRKEDPEALGMAGHDLSALRSLWLAGERLDPATQAWLERVVDVPVVDHWWQTETGWPICANPLGLEQLPARSGSPCRPVPGFDLRILDDQGAERAPDAEGTGEGAVVLKLPLPPGCLTGIWQDRDRFREAYLEQYPGYYLSGDGGYVDADGYVFIMGRVDDVINVAGHRLSTGQMEEVVSGHPAVAECAVIGIQDPDKGQVPLGLVVLRDGINQNEEHLVNELVAQVRLQIGAFAVFRRAVVVPRLPKTRSGKILRQVLRRIADGHEWQMPGTIDDPAVLDEMVALLAPAAKAPGAE